MNIEQLLRNIDKYKIERFYIANKTVSIDVSKRGKLFESEEIGVIKFVEILNSLKNKNHVLELIQNKKIKYTRHTYKYVTSRTGFYKMFGERVGA